MRVVDERDDEVVGRALFRTRTGDPLLTMEGSRYGSESEEQRLFAGFPCY